MANTIAIILVASMLACTSAEQVTPIQKVITMMNAMLTKGKAMNQEEKVENGKSEAWCKQVTTQTTRAISETGQEIEQLSADMAKATSDAEVLAGEISELEKDTDGNEAEAKSASAERKKQHEAYAATHLDLATSIGDLGKAMNVLKSKAKAAPASLMQVRDSKFIDDKAKAVLESFLSLRGNTGAPYEEESNGVMDMLDKLQTKFEAQKLTLEKEEMKSRFAYETELQALTNDIAAGKAQTSRKTAAKAGHLEEAAQAQGDLAVAQKSKAVDEKTLADTSAECAAKSQEFEANQATRSDEIKALSTAIGIISSSSVKGTGEKRLPAVFLQAKSGTAFVSLRSSVRGHPEIRRKAIAYLQAQASKLDSRYLSVAADHAAVDPFNKIKKMVKGMITKLKEEANAEADENGFCTTELATNEQTRGIKSSEVDELSSNVDLTSATSTKLSSQITNLAASLSEIKAKQSEATNIRSAEKKANADVVAEAKESQGAVASAIKVLKDFYHSEKSASLMQDMTEADKAPYKGMGASSGGVLGMLDVVLSDFARLETQTAEAESQAQNAYETFMDESNQDSAVKETQKKHNENNRDRADEKLQGLKKELDMTQTELKSANDYFEKLKAKCIDTGVSYKDRKRMREEEIASLQESLKVLAGEELA